TLRGLVERRAQDVTADVVDVDHGDVAADDLLDVEGDVSRALRAEHDRLVVRRNRAGGRAIDRARLLTGDAIEIAPTTEQLRDGRDGRGEQDSRRADFTERELHRLGNAESDAVRGLRHVARQEGRELTRLDLAHHVRAALHDRDDLLRHEQQIARLNL